MIGQNQITLANTQHRGPLKIENEKIDLEQVNEHDDVRATEKHFIFSDQHEVFDIGPGVEIIPQANQ
ncbi:unnamed protein product [Onchocerca ochengi]|uniref:FHA domain-containing protein n=1 Tax=Onchocerca ochengi TaxID=42157 RepID=A0A182EBU0_ONCOC|nr:unnamed protein product [Onchocerca ochengi]